MNAYEYVKEMGLEQSKEHTFVLAYIENYEVLNSLKQAIADFEMFEDAKSKMFGSAVSDAVVRNWFLTANKGLLKEKGLLLVEAIKRIENVLSEG